MSKKLPLAPHAHGDSFEVGCTNLFGSFRLEDFFETPGGMTHEQAVTYIKRLQAASNKIAEDMFPKVKR